MKVACDSPVEEQKPVGYGARHLEDGLVLLDPLQRLLEVGVDAAHGRI